MNVNSGPVLLFSVSEKKATIEKERTKIICLHSCNNFFVAETARIKRDYGIDGPWPPYNKHYENFDNRYGSFESWFPLQERIKEFAEAGFHYRGQNDSVQCFYCTGILENFEPADNVWREHAR